MLGEPWDNFMRFAVNYATTFPALRAWLASRCTTRCSNLTTTARLLKRMGETPAFDPRLGRQHFGLRIRTARPYAAISQSELAKRIALKFPDVHASGATMQRLETGDPRVKGSVNEWAQRIELVTDVPVWFLAGDWDGIVEMFQETIPREETILAEIQQARAAAEREQEVASMSAAVAHEALAHATARLRELEAREKEI